MDSEDTSVLYFNSSTEIYNVFDNFTPFPCEIQLDDKTWPSSEHYFQAQKSTDPAVVESVRAASDPIKAKMIGRTLQLRSDWEEIKTDIMYKAVKAKFSQHPDLQEILLGTGNRTITEHARDRIWGDGGDGSGENRLGKILVRVRTEIREES